MASYINKLSSQNLITPPNWLKSNVLFEGVTGSVAYGVSNDSSDMDIVGFCMPPKENLFPSLYGEVAGFGTQIQRFEQFQQHHIKSLDGAKSFDISIYSIAKFFHLAMENNPNIVDALFLPRRCVLFGTEIYEHVRDCRQLFLHKGCWHKFRGYAYAQLHKIDNGVNRPNEKRKAYIEEFGYDVKFAYHVLRLILECEQILVEHDLDLERNSAILKSVRRGEWTLQEIKDWFSGKEKDLESVYHKSDLRYTPNEHLIKQLLNECLEMHYGTLSNLRKEQPIDKLIIELEDLVRKYKG